MPSLFYAGQPDYIEKLNTLATAASMTNGTVAASFLSLAVTGTATAASFVGPLTGNASTATTLATARNINGVAFNGSADITVTAAAGTLTGTTLAANVVNASLNSIVPTGGALNLGSAAGSCEVRVDGNTVTGAALLVRNNSIPVIAIANKSAIFGGAYDETPTIYANAPIEVNQALNVTGSISATGGATINSITPAGGTLAIASGAVKLDDAQTLFWGAGSSYILGSSASGFLRFYTGSSLRGGFDSAGLSVTGSISATENITSAGNVIQVGAAGTGTGGNYRITDDGGTLRWLAGLLGTAGARDWTLLEVVSGRTPIRANASTGAVSIDHGLTVTGSISATTGVSTGNTGSVALTIPNNTGIRSADTSGTGTAFIDVANLTVRNPNAAFAPIFDTFAQGVAVTGYIAGVEQAAPAAPAANGYRIFAQDNGAGKTQLMVIFASGAAQQIAIEP